ncbi:putative RNA 3'-terminal phosphate cyclase-like protein [Frankliniella fusca]|uniref:RNA 3'-terminal phosphate cyclase-like protein n=1 Tax=Frankliniella fusca TaxID=407009 RepID=A0AAE1HQH9_9NEOP|nr:putative RNA 3'-terminal phosphate cyclase-like protein [Frankliniella fusca]
MAPHREDLLEYDGCNFLRQRLLLSTLSGKPVRIKGIRSDDNEPGLREFEVNLIRLLDKLTNGSTIEVNETGTSLYYQPGLLIGGTLEHECCKQRGIGYYLEVLMGLGPFCKKPLSIILRGVTNNEMDPSVDSVKLSAMPTLKKFLLVDDGMELKINKRGMAPEGGGEVLFRCPNRKQLKPIVFLDPGKIKRIRGTAYAARVSPAIANRIIEAAKGVLLKFLPDVYLYSDHLKGSQSGKSPGFGVTLVAETKEGVFYTGEAISPPAGSNTPAPVAEDLGVQAAFRLMEEIYRGGCVDSNFQLLAALYMALGRTDVSKFQTGPLSPYLIEFLRHLRDFFGLTFKLDYQKADQDDEDLHLGANKVVMTCVGVGFSNLSKKVS